MLNYRSYHDMSLDIAAYLTKLPVRYDLVVGIPQSGMIAAAMLASYLKTRLASLDLFVTGRCMMRGMTRGGERVLEGLRGISTVLVLDDSVYHGHAMREARAKIEASEALHGLGLRINYAAVYSRDGGDADVDFSFAVCPLPRVFQWNIFNHPKVTQTCCYDIDGVVCGNPTKDQNDDGGNYIEFLRTAAKCLEIKFPVGAFVSSRLEKYRSQTEDWLRRNGFAYGDLVLLDMPTAEMRRKEDAHAAFKAKVYRDRPETLFVESNWKQAVTIARLSGKDVFCTSTMSLVSGCGDLESSVPTGALQTLYAGFEKSKKKVDALRTANADLRAEVTRLSVTKEEQSSKISELRRSVNHRKDERRVLVRRLRTLEARIGVYREKTKHLRSLFLIRATRRFFAVVPILAELFKPKRKRKSS